MGFEYKIDLARNLVFAHFSSSIDNHQLIASFNNIYSDPDYIPVMNQCINYTDVTDWQVSQFGIEEISTMAENFSLLNIPWKTIIIAPEELIYGYARMYQLLNDGSNEEVIVTRSLEAALELVPVDASLYPFRENELN